MTGRLDQVDLDTDLILIVLGRTDEAPSLVELHSKIEAVDTEPFAFDRAFPGGSEEFIQGCRMLNKVGLIEKKHHKVRLSDTGRVMADHLEDTLDSEEDHALEDAGLAPQREMVEYHTPANGGEGS